MEPEQLKESLRASHTHHAKPSSNPQEIFSWSAPVRAYKRKSAGILRFYLAVAILITILLVLFKEFVLIFPVWAVLFLVYVLTITPPHETEHHVTKYGLITHNQPYTWDDLHAFYFQRRFDYNILVVLPKSPFLLPLYMVVDTQKTQHYLMNHLADHLIYLANPPKSTTDKMADWLMTLMPEEEETQGETSKRVEQSPKPQTSEPR